jgi:tRNA (cmo5U34)-methyltransferase
METERVRDHFRVQVPDYPGLMKRLIPFYDEQRDIMLGLVPFHLDETIRVLDLGCGPGLMAEKILSRYPNARLTAFDLTEEMLTACRERLGQSERVFYQAGDFRCDPFGEDYDLIIASLSLHHLQLSERPAFFERAYRSLKTGGLLITAEVILDENVDVRGRQYALWQRFIAQNGEDADYWFARHLQKDHPATISSLLEMLKAAGFHQLGCFWRYLNFAIIAAAA